ncbi:MAG TPA: hypothetical protein VNE39_19850 [Planctomycetota bacterium]|nr:hypothetical protein [Planctomycetota bacterium]
MRPRLRLLSDELIGRILEEAYHLLETKGINLHHEGLMGRLGDLGCRTDKRGSGDTTRNRRSSWGGGGGSHRAP